MVFDLSEFDWSKIKTVPLLFIQQLAKKWNMYVHLVYTLIYIDICAKHLFLFCDHYNPLNFIFFPVHRKEQIKLTPWFFLMECSIHPWKIKWFQSHHWWFIQINIESSVHFLKRLLQLACLFDRLNFLP